MAGAHPGALDAIRANPANALEQMLQRIRENLTAAAYRVRSGCRTNCSGRRLVDMEHRGFEYEIQRAPGTGEWIWAVYTPAPKQGGVSGDRFFAMVCGQRVIDAWCERHASNRPEPHLTLFLA